MAQLTTARLDGKRAVRRSTVSPLLWELAQGRPSLALEKLETSLQGLSDAEVERRRRTYGKNEVAREKPPAWWAQFIRAFSSPFILVLVVLAVVSYITDVYLAHGLRGADWKKVIILAAMILVSGILRFWQEFRSVKAAERLKAMVRTTATVSRARPTQNQAATSGPLLARNDRQEVPIADIPPTVWNRKGSAT